MKNFFTCLVFVFVISLGYSQDSNEKKFKVTFEFISKKENEQFMVLFESNANGENGSVAFAQQGKQIISGWRHTYYTNDKENPIVLKVGTLNFKKRKATINLYINNQLVETKSGKAGNFMRKPLTLMTYYDKIEHKLKEK